MRYNLTVWSNPWGSNPATNRIMIPFNCIFGKGIRFKDAGFYLWKGFCGGG
jgi:hypothetical protein